MSSIDGIVFDGERATRPEFLTRFKVAYSGVEAYHLLGYLDEQAFRFNERDGEDADRFAKTLGSAAGRRMTYDELTGKR